MDPSLLISKAAQLLNSSNPQERTELEGQFTEVISNPDNLEFCLKLLNQSPQFLFVFNEVLGKTLQKGKYLNIEHLVESRYNATDQELKLGFTRAITEKKRSTFGPIISTLNQLLDVPDLPNHTRNQCINVISLCLKSLCESTDDHLIFIQILTLLFPGLVIDPTVTNSYAIENKVIQVNSNTCYIPKNFVHSGKVILSLFQYIQTPSFYKSYFEFRRVVFNFKGQYMSFIVQLAIFYFKTCVFKNLTRGPAMTTVLQIFEQIASYPYSLNIHQYETDEETRELSRGEIYYPPIMRIVFNDDQLFSFFEKLYDQNSQTQNYELVHKDLLLLLRLFSKFFSTNSYFFDNDSQRSKFRKTAVVMTSNILNKIFFMDRSFITAVLEILTRILGLFSMRDYSELFGSFAFLVLNFCKMIISSCSIIVDAELNNPLTILFSILSELHTQSESDYTKVSLLQQQLRPKEEVKIIIQEFFNRITKMQDVGYAEETDWEREIQVFTTFFSTIYDAFKLNQSDHLTSILNLDFSTLSPLSQQFWVYFICTLINQNTFLSTFPQTKIMLIYKVFMSIKDLNNLFVFKFLDLITSRFLQESINTRNEIWNIYHNYSNTTFQEFILFIIKKLIATIYSNDKMFVYVMKILNKIYVSLKKIDETNMRTYSSLLSGLIVNLEKTLFANPSFYKMRVDLYELISIIWIEHNCHNEKAMEEIYTLYKTVSQNLRSNIVVYLYDVRGLIKPIDGASPYKIVSELIIQDMEPLASDPIKVNELMADETIRKAITKLALEISNDQYSRIKLKDHRSLGLKIQKTFRPFLRKAGQYPYGRSLLKAYNHFMNLTPIQQALPLPPKQNCIKPFLQHQINSLINNYFDNIHKVSDLMSLYPYIGQNGDYFHSWCEEIISRESNIEPYILRTIAESRCWKSCRMVEMVSKGLWIMGNYNGKYRVIPELWENLGESDVEEEFEERFERYVAD